MQPATLTHTLLTLRGMVEQEGEKTTVLESIDSFAIQTKKYEKHFLLLQNQFETVKVENRQLKTRTKNLAKQLAKKEKECDTLHQELKIANSVCRSKAQKLNQVTDNESFLQFKKIASQRKLSKQFKTNGTQCQILNQSLIAQLRQQNNILLQKMDNLQRIYDEECNQNNAKQLLIDELVRTLEKFEVIELQREDIRESDSNVSKENDNSTLDEDSQKGENCDEYELPEWLEKEEPIKETQVCQTNSVIEGNTQESDFKNWYNSVCSNLTKFYKQIART